MTTYRERREARAARLRDWAEKRRQKADAAAQAAHRTADAIPFGQPILIGHHSEGRHRADLARIENNSRKAYEHSRKADQMESKADNIDAAADRAIYSDDDDAIPRLAERIAELTATAGRITAYNASCRKGCPDESLLDDRQRADLETIRRVCSYQLRKGGQFPAYATSNINGNVNRLRKRLADLEAKQQESADLARLRFCCGE